MIKLSQLDLNKIKPDSRENTRKMLDAYFKAQEELERICKEKGIEVPVMLC